MKRFVKFYFPAPGGKTQEVMKFLEGDSAPSRQTIEALSHRVNAMYGARPFAFRFYSSEGGAVVPWPAAYYLPCATTAWDDPTMVEIDQPLWKVRVERKEIEV